MICTNQVSCGEKDLIDRWVIFRYCGNIELSVVPGRGHSSAWILNVMVFLSAFFRRVICCECWHPTISPKFARMRFRISFYGDFGLGNEVDLVIVVFFLVSPSVIWNSPRHKFQRWILEGPSDIANSVKFIFIKLCRNGPCNPPA